jgi:hypothetical protein
VTEPSTSAADGSGQPTPVLAFTAAVSELGWVTDVLVAGSLATGDYVPGVSDLDLVAVTRGPVDAQRVSALQTMHSRLDVGPTAGSNLGCMYVDETRLAHREFGHPTWTHGRLVHRALSAITRAELVIAGYAVRGRPPQDLLPPVTEADVRAAARAEVAGYWAWASRRPWMWLDPVIADLGLTSMARGRHAMRSGRLLQKSEAIRQAHAPAWLIDQLGARRRGEPVVSPRVRTGWIAWRDARRTVRASRRAPEGR